MTDKINSDCHYDFWDNQERPNSPRRLKMRHGHFLEKGGRGNKEVKVCQAKCSKTHLQASIIPKFSLGWYPGASLNISRREKREGRVGEDKRRGSRCGCWGMDARGCKTLLGSLCECRYRRMCYGQRRLSRSIRMHQHCWKCLLCMRSWIHWTKLHRLILPDTFDVVN